MKGLHFLSNFSMIAFVISFGYSTLSVSAVNAQEISLTNPHAPIALHQRTPTSEQFSLSRNPSNELRVSLERIDGFDKASLKPRSFRFTHFTRSLPPEAGTYDVLPICTESNVRRERIAGDPTALREIDILFYSHLDKGQASLASSWNHASAPFADGDIYNPYRTNLGEQQYVRIFRVKCLPTRIRHQVRNGTDILEYREGERAWDDGK